MLCMFLIVLGHAMVHGHVLDTLSPNSINYYIVNILRAFLSVHVNCFVLISGYFLCTYKFRLSKVFFIWWQTFFWSVTLYIFVCISGIVPFEIESLLRVCLPLYTAKILVCYYISFNVCFDSAFKCCYSYNESTSACIFYCYIFFHIHCTPEFILLEEIYFNK